MEDEGQDAELKEGAPEPDIEETSEMTWKRGDEAIPIMTVRVAREGEKLNPKRVFLLVGPSNFQGKYNHFASLIPSMAADRIMEGDVFAFCSAQRTQLSVLQWQGDGFALYFKRTEFERYPWPYTPEAKLIEITPGDLRLLLEIPRLIQRMNGIPTD